MTASSPSTSGKASSPSATTSTKMSSVPQTSGASSTKLASNSIFTKHTSTSALSKKSPSSTKMSSSAASSSPKSPKSPKSTSLVQSINKLLPSANKIPMHNSSVSQNYKRASSSAHVNDGSVVLPSKFSPNSKFMTSGISKINTERNSALTGSHSSTPSTSDAKTTLPPIPIQPASITIPEQVQQNDDFAPFVTDPKYEFMFSFAAFITFLACWIILMTYECKRWVDRRSTIKLFALFGWIVSALISLYVCLDRRVKSGFGGFIYYVIITGTGLMNITGSYFAVSCFCDCTDNAFQSPGMDLVIFFLEVVGSVFLLSVLLASSLQVAAKVENGDAQTSASNKSGSINKTVI